MRSAGVTVMGSAECSHLGEAGVAGLDDGSVRQGGSAHLRPERDLREAVLLVRIHLLEQKSQDEFFRTPKRN